MNISELSTNEYLPYYANYINKAGSVDLVEGLEESFSKILLFLQSITEDKLHYQYAEGKWTIKEITQHLLDTERVFSYRALRFSREDKTPLASFEENDYAVSSLANDRSMEALLNEYTTLRRSTISIFKSFNHVMLKRFGIANGGEMSVRALGFVIIGHEKHHVQIIKERYL